MRHSRRTKFGTISLNQLVEDVGIVANTAKIVALPPKGQAPTAEEILLLERVDVRIVREGGVTVVGVPIGTDTYVLEPASETVKGGGHGPPCTLPRRHAGQTSGSRHRHRISRAED